MANTAHWTDAIATLSPCAEALDWLRTQPDADTALATCERGDWMLWLAGRVSGTPDSPSRRVLVGCSADCAALALPQWTARYPDDSRVADCLALCRRYAQGDEGVTSVDLRAAANAAYDAYAAYAAAAAAYAAYAAANAAYDAAYDAARTQTLADCANIVRRHYPTAPKITGEDK